MKKHKKILSPISVIEKLKDFVVENKDLIVYFFSLVYLIGYFGWSFYAYTENIGALPALDIQYFLTGTLICIVLLLSYSFYRLLRKIPQKIDVAISKSPKLELFTNILKWYVYISTLLFIPYVITLIVSLVKALSSPPPFNMDFPNWFLVTRAYVVYLVIFTLFSTWVLHLIIGLRETRTFVGIILNIPLVLTGIFWVLVMFTVFNSVLPSIPQSLGGFRPRCAYLYFRDNISDNSLPANFLLDKEPPLSKSKMLDVLYSNQNILIVRPEDYSNNLKVSYEIRKDTLISIGWCPGFRSIFIHLFY